MVKQCISSAVLILLLVPRPAITQTCLECKWRNIILYDVDIQIPRPTVDSEIVAWLRHFYIAGGVKDYLANLDSSRECIRRFDEAFFANPDSIDTNLQYGSEYANIPPVGPVPGDRDYILHALVAGTLNSWTLTLRLETATTRELVDSAVVPVNGTFDPFVIGRSAAATIGPMYQTLMQFEKQRRDQGAPYAVYPTVNVAAAKTELQSDETTTLDIAAIDCDGVALHDRTIALNAVGGTVAQTSVTTDQNGYATTTFTAGQGPQLATVYGVLLYTRPCGYNDIADCTPATINIERPNDVWVAEAVYYVSDDEYSGNDSHISCAGQRQESITNERTNFVAWVKSVPLPIPGAFQNDPQTVQLQWWVKSSRYETAHDWWFGPGAGVVNRHLVTGTSHESNGTTPSLRLTIGPTAYGFSISNMTLSQFGGGKDVQDSYTQYTHNHTEKTLTLDPTQKHMANVQGVARDTIYTITEAPNPRESTKETVDQKFTWNKTDTCIVRYNDTYMDESLDNTYPQMTAFSSKTTDSWALVHLYGPPRPSSVPPEAHAGIPRTYALRQNYPNPFNPTTVISYQLPTLSIVKLVVLDILGREVATLVDGKRGPGEYTAAWDAAGAASGTYFCKLTAGGFVQTRKMILLK